MTELMDGGEKALVLFPEHARGEIGARAVHFDDVVAVAIGHVEDEIADDERRRSGGGARVRADTIELPDLAAIGDAQGLELAVGGHDEAAIAGEISDGG